MIINSTGSGPVTSSIGADLREKCILVTGGTGSFGNSIVKLLLEHGVREIRILSRDEKKQYDMQQTYAQKGNLRFFLGDVRDFERTRESMRGAQVVFHAAALKQVPNCENTPFEAVLTNVIGAENVRRASIEAGVETVVSISTDKAVKPVNVMGMSKALQEKIMLQPTDNAVRTRFVCVRYGNVLGSRGSVVPLFHRLIMDGKPLPITHPEMTRFQLTLGEAVQLVLKAAVEGRTGELWVRKMPATKVIDLGRCLALGLTGRRDYPEIVVGARPGEKLHEVLVSEEEMWRARELEEHFLIPSWAQSQPNTGPKTEAFTEYASSGVRQLPEPELLALLESEGWFQAREARTPKFWEV